VFREVSGAVGLSGRDLPAAQALAGHASVLARAKEYEASGAFPGQTASGLQALAYLHLLNCVTVGDAIAFARTATAEPPDGGPNDSGPGGNVGNDGSRRDADSSADAPGDSRSRDEDGGPDGGPSDGEDPGGGPSNGGSDGRGPGPRPGGGVDHRALPEVAVPLVTLQGRAARAGENRLLGPLDPALARDLAAAAGRSPYSRWEVTIVDDHGYAVGHGIARPRRGRPHQPQPPNTVGQAFPARVNITVTETRLRQLAAQAEQETQPRSGAPPGDWELAPRTTDRGH
jgi:hypothetical protein